MQLIIQLNQQRMLEWGLNVKEGIVFSFIYGMPSWCKKIQIDGETYCMLDKSLVSQHLPIVSESWDRFYRLIRRLAEEDLVKLERVGNVDYIAVTEKGALWNISFDSSVKTPSTRQKHRASSVKTPSALGKNTEHIYNDKHIEITDRNNTNKGAVHFEEWWAEYPNKKNKKQALQAWRKERLDVRATELISILRMQVEYDVKMGGNVQYVPHASTYINNGLWNNPIHYKDDSNATNNQAFDRIRQDRETLLRRVAAADNGE